MKLPSGDVIRVRRHQHLTEPCSPKEDSFGNLLFVLFDHEMWKTLLSSAPVTRRHVEHRILKTDARHLFRILKDVDRYSQFLPLCSHSEVLRRSKDGKYLDATLTVGMPPMFTEEYISRVKIDPDNLKVHAKSIQSNVLESLSSKFDLQDVSSNANEKQVDVRFEVEMTVSDPIMVQALDQVLASVATRQVEAFEKRCHELPVQEEGPKR